MRAPASNARALREAQSPYPVTNRIDPDPSGRSRRRPSSAACCLRSTARSTDQTSNPPVLPSMSCRRRCCGTASSPGEKRLNVVATMTSGFDASTATAPQPKPSPCPSVVCGTGVMLVQRPSAGVEAPDRAVVHRVWARVRRRNSAAIGRARRAPCGSASSRSAAPGTACQLAPPSVERYRLVSRVETPA